MHKKDEYEKKHEFYDEYHEDDEHEKHGGYHDEHEKEKVKWQLFFIKKIINY